MARNRAAEILPETPAQDPVPEAPPAATVSKAAVRPALAEGIDSPGDGVAFIKEKFGIEMGNQMWSSYKSQEKARRARAARSDSPRGGRPPLTASTPPAPLGSSPATVGGVADSLKAAETLVDRLGADEVIKIAETFRGQGGGGHCQAGVLRDRREPPSGHFGLAHFTTWKSVMSAASFPPLSYPQ